ncbi:SGNH/GDSL hydrolase family protein [Pedobacter mucosus]|uniref:SGNH/GDSL hydrolase family protein n=1 Tax=Pedobacter mucosus TaxID=2895286 RepID=UPI001EE3D71D|nr:SGNH/GDSL hydrolase family protein [Pedobacter mucosus]UKT63962.1 SGNH/GDSL hydrolase family protein [Pedobacter mucosus]
MTLSHSSRALIFLIGLLSLSCCKKSAIESNEHILDPTQTNIIVVGIGDSNLEGSNSVGVSEQNWFNLFANSLSKDAFIGLTNFNDLDRYAIVINGSYSISNSGPTNSSLLLQPGSSISFKSMSNIISLVYDRGKDYGNLEITRNGKLYSSVNANGIEQKDILMDGRNLLNSDLQEAVFEIKCLNNPVLIKSLYKTGTEQRSLENENYFFLRACVSGSSFRSFLPLEIKNAANVFSNTKSKVFYLLALGTNSMYNPFIRQSSDQYVESVNEYYATLQSSNSTVIYIMPPRAEPSLDKYLIEPYDNYHEKALAFCESKNIPFIDISNITKNKISGIYQSDGVHYNAQMHKLIFDGIEAFLNSKKILQRQ